MIMKKALYGLKSSGTAFRAHLANTLYNIGFISTKSDPDVWICPVVEHNGAEYYEYVMCCVYDILSASLDAISILRVLQGQFKLKDNQTEPPDVYLGTAWDHGGRRASWLVHVMGEVCLVVNSKHRRHNAEGRAALTIKMQDTAGAWLPSRA